MTKEQAEKEIRDTFTEVWADGIIKALEQESIDYKTQYENYLKKSGVIISQLRADRDRLQYAFDKLRAEITTLQNRCYALTKGTICAFCKYKCQYKAETEDKE